MLPEAPLSLTDLEAATLRDIIVEEVILFVEATVVASDRRTVEQLHRNAGKRASMRAGEFLGTRPDAAVIRRSVRVTTVLLAFVPPIAVATLKRIPNELLEQFLSPCISEAQRAQDAPVHPDRGVIYSRSAIVQHALCGDTEVVHEAIKYVGEEAWRWPWITDVVKAWRHTVEHGSTSERQIALGHLERIGNDLASGLAPMGAPTLPEGTDERRLIVFATLHELVKSLKRLWRLAGGKNDPDRAATAIRETALRNLTPDEFVKLIEGFETVSHGQPAEIALELAAPREQMTPESLRNFLKAARRQIRDIKSV